MKVLIVKTSALGDIVHTFPALNELKRKIDGIQIDWLVEAPFAGLLTAHPHINEVLTIDTKKWRHNILSKNTWKNIAACLKRIRSKTYDVIFDLQGNTKSGIFTFFAKGAHKVGFSSQSVMERPNMWATEFRYDPEHACNVREESLSLICQYFGWEKEHINTLRDVEEDIKLKITAEEEKLIERNLLQSEGRYKVVVCPGSAWSNKKMTKEALTVLLNNFQNQKDCDFLLLWGNDEERREALEISENLKNAYLLDKLSLPALQNLLSACDFVIAMDSLPLHLAATTKTPTFSIFGPSSGRKFAPYGNHHSFYQGSCPYRKHFVRRCSELRVCPTGACIKDIDPVEICKKLYNECFATHLTQ